MSDTAIATIVSGVVTLGTMIIGWLTMWIKLKYSDRKAEELATKTDELTDKTHEVERKLDTNTAITKAGAAAAVTNAKAAATTAAETKVATQEMANSISKKLNGGVDQAIEAAIKPLRDTLTDHALRDETDMKEVRDILQELLKKMKV